MYASEEEAILEYYNSFLAQYEGIKGINNTMAKPNAEQFILMSINNALYTLYRGYITELGEINGIQIVSIFNDYSTYYIFTRDNMFKLSIIQNLFPNKPSAFTFNNRYSLYKFQGIMPDNKAAGISSASKL